MGVVIALFLAVTAVTIVLSLVARSGKRAPGRPALPPATTHDGRPVPGEPASGSSGRGLPLLIGVLLLLVILGGGFLALAVGVGSMTYQLGRPLRRRGRPRLPNLALGAASDQAWPHMCGLGPWRRARLGARWLQAARAEHASVPAFVQLEAQLAAHGAPAALLDRCRVAAADEGRHADRCYAIARAYSGVPWAPGRMPAVSRAPVELAAIACESALDGCVGEAVAAEVARRGADRAVDPVIAVSLATIAAEEAAHAALAWDVVSWCVARDGAPVVRALVHAVTHTPVVASPGPTDVPVGEVRALVAAETAALLSRLASLPARAVTSPGPRG